MPLLVLKFEFYEELLAVSPACDSAIRQSKDSRVIQGC